MVAANDDTTYASDSERRCRGHADLVRGDRAGCEACWFLWPIASLGLRGPGKETRLAKFAYNDAAAKQLFDQLQEISEIRYPL